MTEQNARIEQLEKEVELLKKRVDYFYEEIRPYIMTKKCKHKYFVLDEKWNSHACYEKKDCLVCEYKGE